MRRILFIKLTSIGDLIHALPALSDAYRAHPDIEFDWVIDENFREVASWHPAVRGTFTTNHRMWRHGLFHLSTYRTIYRLVKTLRKKRYDLVIDGQGNFKTALLTLLTRGLKAGFDKNSVREKIAHIAYKKRCKASREAHAVDRLRQLFAQALDYPLPTTPPDCLIDPRCFVRPCCDLPPSYLVFVHSASWQTKLWPERHWAELIKKSVSAGLTILLPWGNREEEARAKRLASHPQVRVLPRLSLSEIGYVLAHATACVCMDTGLSHLTAALNIPSITLYGSTDSGLTGASGENQIHMESSRSCSPCNKKTCRLPTSALMPPCLAEIRPEKVFQNLMLQLHKEKQLVEAFTSTSK